ncbi:hypothetical protein [Ruegeria sp. HKCCA5763]|uniref:hypothetical protein n=1 Tax=Ruegeria sp. HKCCA5763 TaxID=2682987 RepID=UPI00148A0E42|nr:hypothetical protein [Ruegeria sp. HKCCA5763]
MKVAAPIQPSKLPDLVIEEPTGPSGLPYLRTGYAQGKAEMLASMAEHFYRDRVAAGQSIKASRIAAGLDAGAVVAARPDLFTPAQVARAAQNGGSAISAHTLKVRMARRSEREKQTAVTNHDLSAGLTPEHFIFG